MKNSIFFKFLAVILCAASLLGILGGAAGALVLAEGDLYNRSVDQMLEDNLLSTATIFADQTALRYASQELGGCPQDMTGQRYGVMPDCNYGYTILDQDGNVLDSLNPELKETATVYELPVTGQYMHLVSTETESEKLAKEAQARMTALTRGMADGNGEVIPADGITVNQVIFTNKEGAPIYEASSDSHSSYSILYFGDDGNVRSDRNYDHGPKDQIGFLYYGADRQLMYRSFLEEWDPDFTSAEVGGVLFLSHNPAFTYQTESADGLGTLTFENGHLFFTGNPVAEEAVEETVPETIPETVPETVPETIPETVPETVPEETAAPAEEAPTEETPVEETSAEEPPVEETVPSSASAVPEEAATAAALPPETIAEETVAAQTLPEVTEPILINGKPLEFYQVNRTEFYDTNAQEHTTAKYVYLPLPELTVEVYLDRDTIANPEFYDVLRLVRQYRQYLLPVIGVCLLLFAVSGVYLCTAAGRKPKTDEVRASGLNRMPLDLYLGLGIFAGTGLVALAIYAAPILLSRDFLLGCSAVAAAAFACCLLFVGFCFAFVAQLKTPGGFWWRNTLCGHCIRLFFRFALWLERFLSDKGFPWLGRLCKALWQAVVNVTVWIFHIWEKCGIWLIAILDRFFRWTGAKLHRFFTLIPLTWQWVICGMALFCMLLIACNTRNDLLTFLCLAASFSLILYGAHSFGILLESTKRMSKGDLHSKVDDKLLLGSFQEFASDLNDLADVAMVAAQKQLKSERMKTELITNVSHDIKTPLTSIINYVDLLQKPHSEEETAQYLEVLDRQSQRLKKLVEDLMDMSKASTGNMTVEITRVDAVESVNQALGEFADKLERAQLYPVFHHSSDSVPMMADGKLVWRVLSNLLGNAVKYGMPGTRIYLDLVHVNDQVIISLKNISREELNVNAEELMERFVRGDVSRNTEGSGLGLNIAKSLMELQKGQLQLLVDGDLFKVTLIFPDAK